MNVLFLLIDNILVGHVVPMRVFPGTTNPGGTRKQDNPLKGIWNPIPWKPDNPLWEIRNIVLIGIHSQWSRGLTIQI